MLTFVFSSFTLLPECALLYCVYIRLWNPVSAPLLTFPILNSRLIPLKWLTRP